jgi:hypothetical protein
MPGSFEIARVRRVSWYMDSNWMEECKLSDASSASRNRPGMIYVNDRKADSICVTELWFLVMKSPYMFNHFGGNSRGFVTRHRAAWGVSMAVVGVGEDDVKE